MDKIRQLCPRATELTGVGNKAELEQGTGGNFAKQKGNSFSYPECVCIILSSGIQTFFLKIHQSFGDSTVLLPPNPFRATHCCWSSPDSSGHGLEGKENFGEEQCSPFKNLCDKTCLCDKGRCPWDLSFVSCPARKQAVTWCCVISVLFLCKCSVLAGSARRGAKCFPTLLN